MYKQFFYAAMAVLFALLIMAAWQYQAPYSYEPVGPRAFPLLLLTMLLAGFMLLAFRPMAGALSDDDPAHAEESHPLNPQELYKSIQCVALFLIYAFLFEPLGFVLASMSFGFFMARLFGGINKQSLAVALLAPLSLYLLFEKLLDVPLPPGVLMFWS